MRNKDLYKVINEEIGKFDFLGKDQLSKEEAHNDVLSSKEFQVSLVSDLLNHSTDSEVFPKLSATYVSKDSNVGDQYPATIELELDIEYVYKGNKLFVGKVIKLILFLEGEQSDEEVDYDSFDLTLFSKGGEQIDIKWIENNQKIYNILVKTLIAPYI